MARMNEEPRRRWFRFGLVGLLTLVAIAGVVASLWNPFPKPSLSNRDLIKVGMAEADVVALIGKPDRIEVLKDTADARAAHVYEMAPSEFWIVVYADERVQGCAELWE
jgi:hypothetical protein